MKEKSAESPKHDVSSLLWVEIIEAKPNKMFTEAQRQSVRFMRFNRSVPCAECGKKRKVHWTMLCSFRAANFGGSSFVRKTGAVRAPLTPVCSDHPLALGFSDEEIAARDSLVRR